MDYKNTLNLPQTKFPMKADLPKREPLFLKDWQDNGIYRLIREKSKGKKKYILHDGPPYANGDIHIGHTLNKTLKDIIIRYKTMRGYDSAYVPGWDCHGLPVEHQLFKELKINKYQISQVEFRKKACDYALKYVSIQKEQFIRLGVFGDWQHPYLTLSPDYEETILSSFNELVKKGYIYRGLKPVNWCFKCETALAEAEVEYQDHISPSIYVKFQLDESENYRQETYLVIWTTTPWTLVANVAVAVHPDFIYSYIKTEEGNLILAKDLLPKALEQAGIDSYELIKEIKGKDLEGLSYNHPFISRKGQVVLAEYVLRDEGTGLVHTAPGHGNEDYITGLKYKLEIIMPVDAKGNFDSTAGDLKGLNVYDANEAIIKRLQDLGALLFTDKVRHSYPHCWRCKSAIIFRATKQWFLRLEHRSLRKKLLSVINKDVQWIPEAGRERISTMVRLRPDWCLSRQRYWGVPIPALSCDRCKEEFLDCSVIKKVAQIVREEGSDCWFKRDIQDFLPKGLKCPHCQGDRFSKGSDILDVWFDSGVSNQAVLKKRKDLEFPSALYLEGSDQHRGWFQSSLIPSLCIDGEAPFKSVLTHGFVVDGQGRKMSKSLGNVILPFDIIKNSGADILRLWVASSDYNDDIRISPEILSRLSEAYRKIRNTARFMLSNLYDFDPQIHKINYENLKDIDKWALRTASVVLLAAEGTYESFQFYKAYKLIYDFCNEKLSMYYLDMVKGRLYTYASGSSQRRAAQTTIYEILSILVRMIAPMLVFTAEEIWQHMPGKKGINSSVHLLEWPVSRTFKEDEYFSTIIDLIPDIAKILEAKRSQTEIGSSFDARINILTKDEIRYKHLESFKADLPEIFKVSQVEVIRKEDLDSALVISSKYPDIAIEALKASGLKCQRCWNYCLSVGKDKSHSFICARCLSAIGGK
ncbi:MAG: isoleucine--tRNA ligase [Candidatus Omnitrophica bacterium]|nr:isoleucine--tRNA ligase [Candidatus Omnitrophota bacterium]